MNSSELRVGIASVPTKVNLNNNTSVVIEYAMALPLFCLNLVERFA